MARILTADLGNSRLKVRVFESELGAAATLRDACELQTGSGLAALLATWLQERPRCDVALLSSVASPSVRESIERALAAAAAEVIVRPPAGLDVRCREPLAVGADRLYAARGALALVRAPAIVLDCGTALTVDAVAPPGIFLGGAIAAGPALLARALGDGAAGLFTVRPEPGVPALGRDTGEALAAGVVHGLRGAAAHLARSVSREARFESPAWVITGGGRAFLLEPEPILAGALEVPDLVHHGLLEAIGRRAPAQSAAGRDDAARAPA